MQREFTEFKEFIKDKKTAVVGVGVSNIPLIYFLVKLGAKVTAFDKKSKEELGNGQVKEFEELGVRLSLGEDYLENLKGFEVIFKTPSMRIDNKYLVAEKEEGAYITSEMEEFVRYCPAKKYGITGSDGKTTSTTIIYEILKEEGYKTWVGGNIGTPLFSKIEEMTSNDRVVLELSSFQLMTMKEQLDVALVTNLSPNHLDMHKDMQEYIDAKKNIYLYQEKNDLLVVNLDNEITNNMEKETIGNVRKFSLKNNQVFAFYKDGDLYCNGNKICSAKDVKLVGMHNVANLLGAFSATADDVSVESMGKVATNMTGVEHRTEFVREVNGVRYYNDAIATSPTRVLAGLKAFNETFGRKVILIAGGYDKNVPLEPLAEEGYEYVKVVILNGATSNKIKKAFEKVIEEKNLDIKLVQCDTLEEAVEVAKDLGSCGDIVTLSPACAAFDMFANFAVKGNRFKEIVNSL